MLINQLVGRKAARVGGIPGVTKGVSWFGGNGFLLVDSPGILDPHADARAHRMISWIGSSRSQVIGSFEEHAKDCIEFLIRKNLWNGVEKLWGVSPDGAPVEILEQVGAGSDGSRRAGLSIWRARGARSSTRSQTGASAHELRTPRRRSALGGAVSVPPYVVAGTDEAGRGPLAGPVVAAAAVLTIEQREMLLSLGLNDSKKLTAKKREKIFAAMCEAGVECARRPPRRAS